MISDSQFDLLQERMDSFIVPSDIGRIPYKIRSGFSSFTADQWKNWVVYYSVIVLRDILPEDELECWRHFVLACRVLSRKSISQEQIQLGDILLIQFCRRTERIFGNHSVTPNMHMHCHLSACIKDYGPLHGFWLYAFERYNVPCPTTIVQLRYSWWLAFYGKIKSLHLILRWFCPTFSMSKNSWFRNWYSICWKYCHSWICWMWSDLS